MELAAPAGESCRARVEAALAAIERVQPELNAFTAVRADAAYREAGALDQANDGLPRGLLFGVPVVVKDLFDVAGLPTTGGCAVYRDRVAPSDSAVVNALRAAGAIVVAKANQHELGAGATGLVSCFGPVVNPRNLECITGGSSSGSGAAVAAEVVPLAIGSDTGGSIRMPASFCGVTGLRPTPGRISLRGAQPMSPGYDTAGPMALTALHCAVAFAALIGATSPPASRPDAVIGLRIGLPRPFFELIHPETRRAVEAAAAAFESLGAIVEWLDTPNIDADFQGFPHVWADVAHYHRDVWDNPLVSHDTRRSAPRRATHRTPALRRTAARRRRHIPKHVVHAIRQRRRTSVQRSTQWNALSVGRGSEVVRRVNLRSPATSRHSAHSSAPISCGVHSLSAIPDDLPSWRRCRARVLEPTTSVQHP